MENEKKIWELESTFHKAVDRAILEMEDNNSLTLRDVIKYGFNYINIVNAWTWGFDENDFSPEDLSRGVEYVGWEFDDEGYVMLNLEFKEESEDL